MTTIMQQSKPKLYYGAIIHPLDLTHIQALPRALLAVSSDGLIVWLEEDVHPNSIHEFASKRGWSLGNGEVELIVTAEGEWIMPGFVDTHTHAPQFPMLGTGGQYELLDWLDKITFPGEERFADVAYARRAYQSVVTRIINCGTTTCCYYATLHLEGSKVLADVVHEKGQRAFIGKCNMDRNSPPTYIEPSREASVEDTKKFIQHVRGFELHHSNNHKVMIPLVQPILTPRFAISCSDGLLASIGEIFDAFPSTKDSHPSSTDNNNDDAHHHHPPLLLQTHISENKAEVVSTLALFAHLPPPSSNPAPLPPSHSRTAHSYASIYDHFALLAPRTVLAHAVHLSDPELDLIHMRGAGLAHCAGSNFNLHSGVASVGKWLDRGIKVGLGTDVSGGITPSILTEIRHTSIASKVRAMMDAPPSSSSSSQSPFTSPQGLPLATLLYLATLGGAHVCNLAERIGSLAPGKEFDALLVSLPRGAANPAVWYDAAANTTNTPGGGGETLETMLERFLFGGDDRNIRKVWVRGRLVGGADTSM